MYKRASRAMLHAHRVDSIDPARGYVGGTEPQGDPLSAPDAMTDVQLGEERDRLRVENNRWRHEQQTALALGDERRQRAIGYTMQSVQARSNEINAEIKRRNIARHDREEVLFKRLLMAEIGLERFTELQAQARQAASIEGASV